MRRMGIKETQGRRRLTRRLFSAGALVPPDRRLGELPGTRQAYGNVLHIALPAIAELVLMSLIGSADTIMVGQLGRNALAAVSLPGQPRMIMLALFFALNVGVTAIVASPVQRAQDVLGLEKIVHFRPGYGSATRLIARSGRFGVVSVNESAHFRLS